MKTENKSRYNWSIYFDESKSKRASFRPVVLVILASASIVGAVFGLAALMKWIGDNHGLPWSVLPLVIPLTTLTGWILWPDRYED